MTGLTSSELHTRVFILCDIFRMLLNNCYAHTEKIIKLNKMVLSLQKENMPKLLYSRRSDMKCELFKETDQQ